MYCTNCGTKNDDNARFCVECGEKLENYIPGKSIIPAERIVSAEKGGIRKNIFPIVVLVILAVAVIAFPKLIISGHVEEKIIKEFIEAEMTGDAEKITDIVPEEILEAAKTQGGMSREEFTEELQEQLDSVYDNLESTYGTDWKYSCKITSIDKVTQEELEELENTYSEEFETELDIAAAKTAKVEIAVKGDKIDNSVSLDVGLIKVKNKWYIDFASLMYLL